jgi:glycine/D-amino acid oxidase-like deaminating enzyme
MDGGLMPQRDSYDVVIIGGAMLGSSAAWWLTRDSDASVLVVEPDPTYERAATTATASCIRMQYGTEINVKISQFGVEFIKGFKDYMRDPEAPPIRLRDFGYLYLAADQTFADVLIDNAGMQRSLGAGTNIMSPEQMVAKWPFFDMDGVLCGSHNPLNEGHFDGATMFDWFRRKAREQRAEYVKDRVVGITRDGNRVTHVTLESGAVVACGHVVNSSGTRGATTAAMAGLSVPIEPRRRFLWVFTCPTPLGQDLPLTIDPTGIHMRSDGANYLVGCDPDDGDPAVDPTDFRFDHHRWEDFVWPTIAARVPAFEQTKVLNWWTGHYDYNTLDQNAIIGPHPEVTNFHFCNGFSGHGLQQSPAMGRGLSEMILQGRYTTLDLSELSYERVAANRPLRERAII